MNKKENAKRILSVFLSALIICLSVFPCFAAVEYPSGVTKEQSYATIGKADTAIYNFLSSQDTSLRDIVLPMVYSDEILSSALLEVYKAIETEAGTTLMTVGINTGVSAVAEKLGAYPEVAERLSSYSSWAEADLNGASWGVSTKADFALAVSSMFTPFNDILYALLCGGSYSLNLLVGIKGSNGYETAIMPTLNALGCSSIISADEFYSQAEDNKTTMLYNIVYDVLTFLEEALDAPCDVLTDNLPSIANYFVSGGFDNAVSTLVEPLKLEVLNISTMVPVQALTDFISDSESFTQNFTLNLNDMIASAGVNAAPIDLELIASLGTLNEDGTVTADKADTFIVLLRWIIETVKLNQSYIGQLLPDADESVMQMISGVLTKDTDELISVLVSLFNQTGANINDYQWTFKDFTAGSVTYTPNLGAEKYQRVADGIDELLDQLIAETGEAKSLGSIIKNEIYSSDTLTMIVKTVFSALENEDMQTVTSLLGLDLSPRGVASVLVAKGLKEAGNNLSFYTKWSDIGENGVDWAVKDGNKKEFVTVLASVFSPLNDILGMLLAEDKIVLFDAVEIYGSNGYNTAVIPIYEALGCEASTIKTHEEFKKLYEKGKGVEALLDPIVSLLDRIIEKPVYTLLQILPNLLYFLDGGLTTCINNILYPFEGILSQLGIENAIDLSSFENLDINQLLTEIMGSMELGITMPDIDVNYLASLGTAVQMTSKRTTGDQFATVTYIQADMPALALSLMRILARTIKAPENSSLIDTLLESENIQQLTGTEEDGMGDIVGMFAQGIIDDLNAMTEDQATEWLYKLFFRERATVETFEDSQEYMPTIIYKPKRNYTPVLAVFAVLILIPVCVIVYNKIKMRKREDDISQLIQEV